MNSKERVATLLRREVADRMGLYEHFWPETLRDYWPKEGYPQPPVDPNGRRPFEEWPDYYFGYDLVNCGGWFDTAPFPGRREVVEETAEWEVIRDGRGATLKFWKKKSGTPEHIGFTIDSPEKWKEYRQPLLETNRQRLGDLTTIKKALAYGRQAGKFTVFGNMFVFELMRATIGDQNFLPALLLEPAWIRDFCQVYLDFFRRHYSLLFSEVGLPDGFFLYEDFGFRNGLFCSPQTLSELIIPYEKELVGFFHDYGLPVLIHSCGDIRKAIPLIIEAGFDCLQPLEAKAGCNIIEIAGTYGKKIAYMGNINVVSLNSNDRRLVAEEVVPKLKWLSGERIPYFFHSDHSLPPTVKLSTYRYSLELFEKYSRY